MRSCKHPPTDFPAAFSGQNNGSGAKSKPWVCTGYTSTGWLDFRLGSLFLGRSPRSIPPPTRYDVYVSKPAGRPGRNSRGVAGNGDRFAAAAASGAGANEALRGAIAPRFWHRPRHHDRAGSQGRHQQRSRRRRRAAQGRDLDQEAEMTRLPEFIS